jgi:hypothetical protein
MRAHNTDSELDKTVNEFFNADNPLDADIVFLFEDKEKGQKK